MSMIDKDFDTVEEGMDLLKKAVEVRNKMGGNMYWSMLNDEVCKIGSKTLKLGGDYEKIADIIGRENFR